MVAGNELAVAAEEIEGDAHRRERLRPAIDDVAEEENRAVLRPRFRDEALERLGIAVDVADDAEPGPPLNQLGDAADRWRHDPVTIDAVGRSQKRRGERTARKEAVPCPTRRSP